MQWWEESSDHAVITYRRCRQAHSSRHSNHVTGGCRDSGITVSWWCWHTSWLLTSQASLTYVMVVTGVAHIRHGCWRHRRRRRVIKSTCLALQSRENSYHSLLPRTRAHTGTKHTKQYWKLLKITPQYYWMFAEWHILTRIPLKIMILWYQCNNSIKVYVWQSNSNQIKCNEQQMLEKLLTSR